MNQGVEKAIEGLRLAAARIGLSTWFLAMQDPDSNARQCRMGGDTEAGFAVAHFGLAGQGAPLLAMGEAAQPLIEAMIALTATGVPIWFFCGAPGGHSRIFTAYQGDPLPAFGVGVTCLHVMVQGALDSKGIQFNLTGVASAAPPAPPSDGPAFPCGHRTFHTLPQFMGTIRRHCVACGNEVFPFGHPKA